MTLRAPRISNCLSAFCLEPSVMAIMTITDAMPSTMPNAVSRERSMCSRRFLRPSRIVSSRNVIVWRRRTRLYSRGAFRWLRFTSNTSRKSNRAGGSRSGSTPTHQVGHQVGPVMRSHSRCHGRTMTTGRAGPRLPAKSPARSLNSSWRCGRPQTCRLDSTPRPSGAGCPRSTRRWGEGGEPLAVSYFFAFDGRRGDDQNPPPRIRSIPSGKG